MTRPQVTDDRSRPAGGYLEIAELEGIVTQFLGGKVNVEVGDDLSGGQVVENARRIKGLIPAAEAVLKQAGPPVSAGSQAGAPPDVTPLHLAAAIEFVLEALHVNNKLSKYAFKERVFYKRLTGREPVILAERDRKLDEAKARRKVVRPAAWTAAA